MSRFNASHSVRTRDVDNSAVLIGVVAMLAVIALVLFSGCGARDEAAVEVDEAPAMMMEMEEPAVQAEDSGVTPLLVNNDASADPVEIGYYLSDGAAETIYTDAMGDNFVVTNLSLDYYSENDAASGEMFAYQSGGEEMTYPVYDFARLMVCEFTLENTGDSAIAFSDVCAYMSADYESVFGMMAQRIDGVVTTDGVDVPAGGSADFVAMVEVPSSLLEQTLVMCLDVAGEGVVLTGMAAK